MSGAGEKHPATHPSVFYPHPCHLTCFLILCTKMEKKILNLDYSLRIIMKCLSLFFYFCFVHKIGKEVNVLFFFSFCFEKRTNDKRIPFPLRGDWGGRLLARGMVTLVTHSASHACRHGENLKLLCLISRSHEGEGPEARNCVPSPGNAALLSA